MKDWHLVEEKGCKDLMSGTGTYEICKVPCLKFVFLANFSSFPLFLLYENATI